MKALIILLALVAASALAWSTLAVRIWNLRQEQRDERPTRPVVILGRGGAGGKATVNGVGEARDGKGGDA